MKISGIQNAPSFGRALTTKEKQDFQRLQAEARKQLDLDKTTATIFDFSVPSGKKIQVLVLAFHLKHKIWQVYYKLCVV